MQTGELIAVNGNLYEYVRKEKSNLHRVSEVEIDEDGYLTATYVEWLFTDAELSNRGINLTEKQWIGLTEHFLREEYDLNEEEIADAAEDIVCRCFATTRTPLVEELPNYIAIYMDR
jgi:hypothetical protein